VRHACSVIGAWQFREMDNSQCNGAGAPPAEEQVQQVEETFAVGDPQGGVLSGAGTAPEQVQREMAQNIAQGDSATPLKTGARKRTDAEKQRAAKAKAAPAEALTEQDRERQQRLAAGLQELLECLKTGMGILTQDQGGGS
jgi:hypothetical protein